MKLAYTVDSTHRKIVAVRPSTEEGFFVGHFDQRPRIGRVALLHNVQLEDFEQLKAGNHTVLEKYARPDPDRPGYYMSGTGISIRKSVSDYGVEILDPDSFMEVVPFVPVPIGTVVSGAEL